MNKKELQDQYKAKLMQALGAASIIDFKRDCKVLHELYRSIITNRQYQAPQDMKQIRETKSCKLPFSVYQSWLKRYCDNLVSACGLAMLLGLQDEARVLHDLSASALFKKT